MKNQIIYSLNTEDLQNVAQQEIERELSSTEIIKLKEIIAKKINWYDAVADSITEFVDQNNKTFER